MSNWLPSLNSLRAFEAVSRHLNYRRAAEELHVSPGAANQLVRKLEESLGGKLLEKKGRKLILTPMGVVGRDGLSPMFRHMVETVDRMRKVHGTRRLVVSTTPSFAASWLVPRLESFKQQNPGMEVLIDSTPHIVDLEHGVADVGIRFGVKEHGNLRVHRLFDEVLCAFCSPRLAKGPPEISRLEYLEDAVLLRWDLAQFDWAENTSRWNHWKHWLAQMGAGHVKPGSGSRFSDYNLAVQAAIAGQGFIIGSKPILHDQVKAGLLVNPFQIEAQTDVGYDLAVSEQALSREEVAAFVQWVVDQAKSSVAREAV